MDLTSISTALSSLVAAKDIAQSMVGLRDAAAFQEKRFELQSKIMDAQSSVFLVNEERTTLIKRVSDLEEQIAGFETWETEKQRYEFKQVCPMGGFAYVLKTGVENSETTHCLCADCYERSKKRFLQGTKEMLSGYRIFHCNECRSNVPVDMRIFNAS
jgi:hypothetical protein